jgi:maleylacetoacetate isomerase
MTPILYTFARSSASFRVRIALNLKGIVHELKPVMLTKAEHLSSEFAQLNPQALLPTWVDDSGTLTQSLAIMEYLDEVYPGAALMPQTALSKARVRAISQAIACEIHPLNNLKVLKYLKTTLAQDENGVNTWYRHWIANGLAPLELMLANSVETGLYCHGDQPTIADCCLVPQIFNAKRYDCDLAPYPKVMQIFNQCMTLDAFDKAQPSRQPEFVA